MIRRPPRSTPFPTRRSSDLVPLSLSLSPLCPSLSPFFALCTPLLLMRSEEHTSELQSRPHLVCRLLLEKNKMIEQILVYYPQFIDLRVVGYDVALVQCAHP